jgi:hypothetical protein
MASNWVIPGMVMAGAFPGALDDRENELQLRSILNKGIDTFVCLQAEVDDEIPEEAWRNGDGLRPYFVDARRISKKPLIWRHLPIVDGGIPEDDVMEALVCDLLDDVKAGRVIYVHCWGGHGRTGIVACLLLAVLYGLQPPEAFKRVQGYHDCRVEPQGVKSPQTVAQRSQVKRLLQRWMANPKESAVEYAKENVAEGEPSTPKEPVAPQVVVAKNGARGFVVPPERSAPKTIAARADTGNVRQALPPTQPAICMQPNTNAKNLQVCKSLQSSNSSIQRGISMDKPMRAGRAAGTGAAAVQILRKSSAAKLALA